MSKHPTTNGNTVIILSHDRPAGYYDRDPSFLNSGAQEELHTTKVRFSLLSLAGTKEMLQAKPSFNIRLCTLDSPSADTEVHVEEQGTDRRMTILLAHFT